MRDLAGGRWILWGIIGAVVGGLAQTLVNRAAGTELLRDGMLWGVVLAYMILSVPSFARMGQLAVGGNRHATNLIVGVLLFVVISALIIGVFVGFLWLVGRLVA